VRSNPGFRARNNQWAAGTRVRKAMQDVKNIAQSFRAEMLESRKEG